MPFFHTARQLLGTAGRHNVPIRLRGGKGASADTYVVTVSRWMADRSVGYQRWSAAHEVAHVILRHRGEPVRVFVLLGIAALCCAGAAGSQLLHLATLVSDVAVATTTVGMAGMALPALFILARVHRQQERDADQLAASWGYPITAEIAAILGQYERPPYRWVPALRSHDLPEERRRLTSQ
jgi:hypothetical protein